MINNESQYEEALQAIGLLMDKAANLTDDENKKLQDLSLEVENYEKLHYPMIDQDYIDHHFNEQPEVIITTINIEHLKSKPHFGGEWQVGDRILNIMIQSDVDMKDPETELRLVLISDRQIPYLHNYKYLRRVLGTPVYIRMD